MWILKNEAENADLLVDWVSLKSADSDDTPSVSTGLLYRLELTDDLVDGIWTNAGYTVTGTNGTKIAGFEEVTNAIPTLADQTFIKLKISEP